MQPWMNLAERLQNRETRLHKSIFQTLKRQVGLGAAPDCVGKALIEVLTSHRHNSTKLTEVNSFKIKKTLETTRH